MMLDFRKLPQVKFELIDIDKEIELFYSFAGRSTFSFLFEKHFPELLAIRKEYKDEVEGKKKFKEFLEILFSRTEEEMAIFRDGLESGWDKISPEFLKTLSDHFETKWPEDKPKIIGYITNLPVFPRFLDEYKFCVGYKDVSKSVETSAHEIFIFSGLKSGKRFFLKWDAENTKVQG